MKVVGLGCWVMLALGGAGCLATAPPSTRVAAAPRQLTAEAPPPRLEPRLGRPDFTDESVGDAVSRALAAALGDAAVELSVAVDEGAVTLSGRPASPALAWMALETAATVKGVRTVVNGLLPGPIAASDSELADQVRGLLGASPATSGEAIDVESRRYVVTLAGDVSSDAVARRAVDLAASVGGVLDVQDHLRARTPTAAPRPPEAEIRAAIARRLGERLQPDSRIHVQVDGSHVTLNGRVVSPEDRASVLGASWVSGVRSVDGRGLAYVWWTARPLPAWRPSPLAGDDALRRALSAALVEDDRFAAAPIEVRVERGVAVLRGRVPSSGLARAAEAIAGLREGIRDVRSELRVDPAVVASDAVIERTVRRRLSTDPYVGPYGLEVKVQAGRVFLSGQVQDASELGRALFLASGVPGVAGVDNGLQIARPVGRPRG